ncbi:hypothetical protein [Caballeronia grimmiae]|uniref:hypothetical protein n=1 Tax=Caballeronia grimmiae TaxID=1071679 RepID=UPI0038B93A43
MNTFDRLQMMLGAVSTALGDDLLDRVAFVGGCVVGLLLTDAYSRQQVRATDDVDLVVDVVSYAEYAKLEAMLRDRGFVVSPYDDVNCRWRLGELIVDVMPTDEKILGFSNRWYPQSLATAQWHQLDGGAKLKVVQAPYFLGTKLDAFENRGASDLLASRDAEDIFNLVDGRDSLEYEIAAAEAPLREFVTESISRLLEHTDFEYAIQSATNGNMERSQMLFDRFTTLAKAKRSDAV